VESLNISNVVVNDQLVAVGENMNLLVLLKLQNACATVAYKQATLNAMAYLQKIGYTREQACLLTFFALTVRHRGVV